MSLFLADRGFNATEIGWLSATVVSTRIIAPNIWGWLADHTKRRLLVVRFGALAGFLAFLGIFFATSFSQLAAVLFLFSFFWNAILAQFEVITLGSLGNQRQRYSQVRLWGSLGFILAALALGWLFDFIAIGYLPYFITALLFCIFISCLCVPSMGEPAPREGSETTMLDILRQPQMLYFFLVIVLLQVSHAPYYVFFTLYLDEQGYSRALAGQLWALGVLAEIGLFLIMHQLSRRFSLRLIIIVSLGLTVVRWLLLAYFVTSFPILLFAQCLHAFSFGALHACSIEVVHRYFSDGHAGKGQALYSAASFGLGAALGASIVGYLWSVFGATATYLFGALIAVIAMMFAIKGLTGNKFI